MTPINKPIFIIGGSKGGVGKSMVALALVDDLCRRGESVLLVETDTSNPDVWRMYEQDARVVAEALDLDQAEGWIDLANLCDAHAQRVVVINTAARNHRGVAAHGEMLNRALPELWRRLVTLWVINTQRDSLDLLEDYLQMLPGSAIHVVRNTFFGTPDKFDLYSRMPVSHDIDQRGGQVLTLDRLADRVSGELYSKRLSVAKALQRGPNARLPLGSRAELERWREAVARMFAEVVPGELGVNESLNHSPLNPVNGRRPETAPDREAGRPA
jgi:hypothetical protein